MNIFSANWWITSAAVVAFVVFVLKICRDALIRWQRRKHLLVALKVYIERATTDMKDAQEKFNLFDLENKIKREEGFTPYAIYDDITEGLTIRDILLEYSFLDGETMGKVVDCMAATNYLFSIYKELRTDYVRSFSLERKISILRILNDALNDATQQSNDAYDAVTNLTK